MTLYKNVNGKRIQLSEKEEAETLAQWAAADAEKAAKAWLDGRLKEYPSVGDQLDMLWHELDANGIICTDGEWFKAIKAVKNKYPKPE